MNDLKAIIAAFVIAAIIGSAGHWAVTTHGAAVAEERRQAREARLAEEAAAREAAEAATAAERRQRAIALAQTSAGTTTGGYNPMAAPANPMMSGIQGGAAAEPGVELNPEFGNLPDTEGMEETYYLCSACHSVAIIKQQHISDARWDYLWGWMIEAQGMPEQSPEAKETILSYLKRHFSSER